VLRFNAAGDKHAVCAPTWPAAMSRPLVPRSERSSPVRPAIPSPPWTPQTKPPRA